MRFRAHIQFLLKTLPIINRLYFRFRIYRLPLSEKALRGRIQHIGHSIDLKLTRRATVPLHYRNELSYLIRLSKKQNISFDETLQWVLGLLNMAKFGIAPHKELKKQIKPDQKESKELSTSLLVETIKKRRSVRQWTSENIDVNAIINAVNIAKWAPSSCNRQLWKVLFLQNEHEITFAGQYFSSKFVKNAPLALFILMDSELYAKTQKHYAYLDAGGFIQTLLLCIHGLGYGACWLGFKYWDTAGNIHCAPKAYDEFYRFYDLESNYVPVSLIAVGNPKIEPAPPARQSTDFLIMFNNNRKEHKQL